jgi:TolB-like protein
MRALSCLLWASIAHAAVAPTVAVMPFKDLSGGKGNVGEAIRETVTSDLKSVSGMRVIERGRIDQILAEQHLQANKTDLDATSTVKVGKLLGASLIVTGAYQRAASSVRLTARFVKVETAEIVGTAKVDGGTADFLRLQDKVTAELLKSAGIEQKHVQRFATRERPKLKDLKPIELYGDAVVETDDAKKKQLLVASLDADPTFTYAAHDLDALEQRLRQYDKAVRAEQDKQLREMQQQLGNENDPAAYGKVAMMLSTLMQQRRYGVLRLQCKALENSKIKAPGGAITVPEYAMSFLVQVENASMNPDGVLREGERFLARFPGSFMAPQVRQMMEMALDHKREQIEGEKEVLADVGQMSATERADLCLVASKYNAHKQFREAKRLMETCLERGRSVFPRPVAIQVLLPICLQMGDFPCVRKYLGLLEKEDHKAWESMKSYQMMMPAD